ncbi:hypothetical protein [Candidatus Leptofilum sp.]|uniref:hypothetical protein n=1 Tax=Candidatus Leptofilum sp. TaxID=3241576 RepID=UPI003B5A0517
MPEIIVQPIHFEDRSGYEFERLAFAYLLRTEEWDLIEWYGQLGSDRGRDIWGVLSNRHRISTICYQCANHQRLTFKKAKEDIDKICSGPNQVPSKFVLIIGGKISANMRNRIDEYAKSKGIFAVEIWSGTEFEERLRKDTPSLIRRFCEGEAFPESVSEISAFILKDEKFDDNKILTAYASCFDRPAFTTPFYRESNLPHFKKAIGDTIEALQTGIHRLRDGTIIKRFPPLNEIRDIEVRDTLREIVVDLQKLRASFENLLRIGAIRACGCGREDCPVYFLSSNACHEMDSLRREILEKFRAFFPEFQVEIWR